MQKKWFRNNGMIAPWLVLLALWLAGCSTFGFSGSRATTDGAAEEDRDTSSVYYDFGDVLIPSQLKLNRKTSFVFHSASMTAGVLSFSGRLDASSLVKFFETSMGRDNWQPVSSFRSVRTIMLFRKENRWCVINISEDTLTSSVEVWVAPTGREPEGGLLK